MTADQIGWRAADGAGDIDLLAAMNLQLIEDEQHPQQFDLAGLRGRMADFLAGDYTAILFEAGGAVCGYALFHPREDYIYLRQLFVRRGERRRGLGRRMVELLLAEVIPADARVVVSALSHNHPALAFWASVGFSDYCRTFERLPAPPRTG